MTYPANNTRKKLSFDKVRITGVKLAICHQTPQIQGLKANTLANCGGGTYGFYQMKGRRRYFTLRLYSAYPSSSDSRRDSSPLILFAMMRGYTRKIRNEYSEPRTRGKDRNRSMVAVYIGCLTIP